MIFKSKRVLINFRTMGQLQFYFLNFKSNTKSRISNLILRGPNFIIVQCAPFHWEFKIHSMCSS